MKREEDQQEEKSSSEDGDELTIGDLADRVDDLDNLLGQTRQDLYDRVASLEIRVGRHLEDSHG